MRRKEGSSPTVACVEGGLSGGRAEDGQGGSWALAWFLVWSGKSGKERNLK